MKKTVAKIFCFVLVCVSCIGIFSGCNKSPVVLTDAELKLIYDETAAKTFPTGAWVPTPEPVRDPAEIEARYADMKAAGIDFVICSDEWSSDEWTTAVLNAAQKNDIGVYLHLIPRVGVHYMIDYVTRFKDHPALAGIYLKDEPIPEEFEDVAALAETIRKIVPAHVTVTANLLPTYSMSLPEYTPYVQDYLEIVHPDTLWFDHYPYFDNPRKDDSALFALAQNLDIIRAEAQKKHVDACSFIQNSSWEGNRAPTAEELRFLVNFNIMFGIRGIAFYIWADYPEIGDSVIALDGSKTETYYTIQKINAGLDAMKGVCMTYEQDGFIFHNARIRKTSLIYQERAYETYGPLTELVSDGQILVGCFKKENGTVGLYVVNYDRSKDGDTSVTLQLKGNNEYLVWGTDGLESGGRANSITFDLLPGDAKFITFEKGIVK